MRDMIQRELEKEMIREKIIAEEVERFKVLEAEVRKELMIGREIMALKSGSGFPSSFMPSGNPSGTTLHAAKPEPPPPSIPAAGVSTELNSCSSKKIELRCTICKTSASSERNLLQHLAGRKHHAKAASIVVKNPPKCAPSLRKKMDWRCPICKVSAPCERGLQDHLAGKKHQAEVEAMRVDNIEKAMKSLDLEWRCPICRVKSTSEIDLQNHLAGKKHKAKVAII